MNEEEEEEEEEENDGVKWDGIKEEEVEEEEEEEENDGVKGDGIKEEEVEEKEERRSHRKILENGSEAKAKCLSATPRKTRASQERKDQRCEVEPDREAKIILERKKEKKKGAQDLKLRGRGVIPEKKVQSHRGIEKYEFYA